MCHDDIAWHGDVIVTVSDSQSIDHVFDFCHLCLFDTCDTADVIVFTGKAFHRYYNISIHLHAEVEKQTSGSLPGGIHCWLNGYQYCTDGL